MKQVILLVEGQTEEALVRDILAPAALTRTVYLQSAIVKTSATPAGSRRGGGTWKHYDTLLRTFLSQPHWHKVGVLIDYYGYPPGAPARDAHGASALRQQAQVNALRKTYADPRFRPLVVLHEIEALVLAAIQAGQGDGVLSPQALARLRADIKRAGGPELVNDGQNTSPSKRLLRADPDYLKTVTGPRLIADAGLRAILERCPVFATWWEDLLT